MLQLDAAAEALVAEGGGHLVAFLFVVLVVGHAQAQAQAVEPGEGVAQFAAHVPAAAAQVDHGHAIVVLVVMVVPFVVMAVVAMATAMQVRAVRVAVFDVVVVPRQAVARPLLRVRHAQEAARAHPGKAHAAGAGAVETALHTLAAFPAAAHGVVAIVAAHAFDVQHQRALAHRHLGGACLAARSGIGAQLGAAFHAFGGRGGGHLVVQHVHHAAHGTAALDQCGRAAQHLDLAR